LAEPGSSVDLYDNNGLVGRLANRADASGRFSQTFSLAVGSHALTVIAIDASGNSSPVSNVVNLTILGSAPAAPLILSPDNNSATAEVTPLLTGVAGAGQTVVITIDGGASFEVEADASGAWSFRLPGDAAGQWHSYRAVVRDQAGQVAPRPA
jgi:hypothetical protein